jgi:hypothetical protein
MTQMTQEDEIVNKIANDTLTEEDLKSLSKLNAEDTNVEETDSEVSNVSDKASDTDNTSQSSEQVLTDKTHEQVLTDTTHDVISKMPKGKELVTVDDEFIEAQPEEVKKYLSGIKGETLSLNMLKTYVNEQWYIDTIKKQQKQSETKQFEVDENFGDKDFLALPAVETEVNSAVVKILREKYPDLPANATQEEIDDFIKDLQFENPRKAIAFIRDEEQARADVQKAVEKIVYLQNNWKTLAAQSIENAVERVNKKIQDSFGVSLEDLGVNLHLDDKLYNEFLYERVLMPDKKVNTRVVKNVGDVFVIDEDAAASEILNNILDFLGKKVRSGVRTSEIVPPPSPKSSISGKKAAQVQSTVKSIDVSKLTPDMPIEEIDRALESLIKGV